MDCDAYLLSTGPTAFPTGDAWDSYSIFLERSSGMLNTANHCGAVKLFGSRR